MHQFIKLDELIEFTNFHGADFLIGDGNVSRVQPVTCYKFKMDWIIFRLVQFAKCILLAECSLINDGLIHHHNDDELLDLFCLLFLFMMLLLLPPRTLNVFVIKMRSMRKPEFWKYKKFANRKLMLQECWEIAKLQPRPWLMNWKSLLPNWILTEHFKDDEKNWPFYWKKSYCTWTQFA